MPGPSRQPPHVTLPARASGSAAQIGVVAADPVFAARGEDVHGQAVFERHQRRSPIGLVSGDLVKRLFANGSVTNPALASCDSPTSAVAPSATTPRSRLPRAPRPGCMPNAPPRTESIDGVGFEVM